MSTEPGQLHSGSYTVVGRKDGHGTTGQHPKPIGDHTLPAGQAGVKEMRFNVWDSNQGQVLTDIFTALPAATAVDVYIDPEYTTCTSEHAHCPRSSSDDIWYSVISSDGGTIFTVNLWAYQLTATNETCKTTSALGPQDTQLSNDRHHKKYYLQTVVAIQPPDPLHPENPQCAAPARFRFEAHITVNDEAGDSDNADSPISLRTGSNAAVLNVL